MNTLSASDPRQDLTLARVYNVYRISLAIILLTVYVTTPDQRIVGAQHGELFVLSCGIYLVMSIAIALLLARRQQPLTTLQNFISVCMDLVLLMLATHASGGVGSGLALLLIVSVAAASIQLRGQLALLVAALATLALLFETAYLIVLGLTSSRSLLPAGLLGALFFATCLFIRTLARRIRTSQQLAQSRAQDVSKLLQLNEQIVQRMRTGVLVISPDGQLRMLNRSAGELLEIGPSSTPVLPAALHRELYRWQGNSLYQAPPFRPGTTGPELLVRFTSLAESEGDTLVFVEDYGQLTQRAQQIKLAALGRLTASIAHEIRNPLGAISHAAQLLQETPDLSAADRRLAEIIQNHSRRMNGIIENVLQLSRRSAPNPQRLLLHDWLQGFVDSFLQSHPQARIRIDCHDSAEINADPDQLDQVLTNLVENALRYSNRATGQPRAELRASNSGQAGLWVLDVIDDGPGISEADAEKVFEPFYTTDNQGSGLGLYIARELCEINQARLNYTRTIAGKSCFRISFAHPDRKPLAEESLQEPS